MGVPVEKLVKAYIKIRDQRSELTAKYKERKVLSDKADKIKRALLDHCKEHNVESVRTSEGLSECTAEVLDERLGTNVYVRKEHDVPEFFEKRLNQTNVRQFRRKP